MRRTSCVLPLALLLLTACARSDSETWGFVATLGNDTTSVERITREGDHISGIALGRSPRVVLRRWEGTLAPDGSFSRWSMDTRIANAPAGENQLHHELELLDGAVRVVRRTGSDTVSHTFATTRPRTVPWNAFLYATFENLLQAAHGLPDSTRLGIYFFEGWEEGKLGFARVRQFGEGAFGITSSGLSGEGTARVDGRGRLLSYSGEGTTYKQEVRRVDDVPDIEAMYERFAADERARGVSPVLSSRDTMRATLHGVAIAVDYSRPLARGRTLVGGLIPYDRVWRTGANAATQLMVDAPIRLAGVPLDAGTYTLWTLPARDGVQLIINRQTGQWGTGYGAQHDIARVAMRVGSTDAPVEQFTIRIDQATSELVMEWGDFRWSAPVATDAPATDAPASDPPASNDAAAAQDVIRRYYAAIEGHRWRDAWLLWSDSGRSSGQSLDAFTAGFSRTAHVEVDVGAPGPIEGAAGSRYVEVPVVVRARTAEGAAQRFAGSYTLRRAVVDGATATQRTWHIHSAALRPAP